MKAARARLDEARSILGKYEAEVERWDIQVKRLAHEVERTVVDPQILLESQESVECPTSPRGTRRRPRSRRPEAELLAARGRRWPRPRSRSRSPALTAACRERGQAARGLGGLPQASGPIRRHHRGPQCQYLGLRPAQYRRSHGRDRAPTCRPAARPPRSTWWIAPTSSGSTSISPNGMPTTCISVRKLASRSGPIATSGCRHR